MKNLFRLGNALFILALAFSAFGYATPKVSALDAVEIVSVDSPGVVAPGQSICFQVTVKVNSGQLLESRGDMLRNTDGNLFGHWPHIAVVGTVNSGGTYTFTCYGGMVAPTSEGNYESKWRVWQNATYVGQEAVVRFEVRVGGGGGGGSGGGGGGGGVPIFNDGQLNTPILAPNAPPPIAPNKGFSWPMESPISPYIGYADPDTHCGGIHHAKDYHIEGSNYLPVYAVADGKVIVSTVEKNSAGQVSGFGEYIIIRHKLTDGTEVFSLYAHLAPGTRRVVINQLVHRGDWIGREDTSGGANNIVHLHFELRKSPYPANTCPKDVASANQDYYDPHNFILNHLSQDLSVSQEATLTTNVVATEAASQTGTINPGGQTGFFSFLLQSVKAILTFVLNFPGSNLEITIYRPDGSVYGVYQTDQPPLLVTIPNPEVGNWTYSIRAIEVPYPDYPYAVSIGVRDQPLINTGETDDDDDPLHGYTGDVTPPSTTLVVSPTSPDGNNGWYKVPVQVELVANDNPDGFGVSETLFSLDGGLTYVNYTAPFSISTEGVNTLMYYSVDGGGNREAPQTATIKIDLTPPTVTVTTDYTEYTRVQPFTVHFNGYDPMPGSGLLSLTALFNNQPVVDGQVIDLFWLPLGTYTLTATGEDNAGWITTNSKTINLIATISSLQQAVNRLCAENYITKQGTCTSLSQKLASALSAQQRGQNKTAVNVLLAFQNELKAQKGKAVTAQAYDLLMMDSNYVIQVLGGK